MDAQRAKLNIRIDNIASREAQLRLKKDQLRAKLQSFKDQRKANLVDKINSNLDTINKRRTTQMTAILEKLSKIVDKIETKTEESSASEENKEKIRVQASDLRASIDSTREAITSQSAMDYTIKISSESAAKADARTSRDALHKDLQLAHSLVKQVRKDVVELISSYGSLIGGTNGNQ